MSHLRLERDPEAGADQAQRQVEDRNLRTFCREDLARTAARAQRAGPPITVHVSLALAAALARVATPLIGTTGILGGAKSYRAT
jgi:hypothetical protein